MEARTESASEQTTVAENPRADPLSPDAPDPRKGEHLSEKLFAHVCWIPGCYKVRFSGRSERGQG